MLFAKIEAHLRKVAHINGSKAVRERQGCRSGYCGRYHAGGAENIRSAVARMRRAIANFDVLRATAFVLRPPYFSQK